MATGEKKALSRRTGMILAYISLTVDPSWPWSLPALGASALGGTAILLTGLTIWTYLGVRSATWRRVGVLLTLRLVALLVAVTVVLRPALAFHQAQDTEPSRLFFLLDSSESMRITDGFDNLSRWSDARRILATSAVKSALAKLTAAKVELGYYQGAEDLRKYAPEGQPVGKATDVGNWLHDFFERHGKEKNLRGLALLSDGADNGTKFPTLAEAAQLRGICPVFAFGLGRPSTNFKQNDIDLTELRVEPDPVPVKGKLTVKGYADAPGFEKSAVSVSLWLQQPGAREPKLAATVKQILSKTLQNEIVMSCDAPETPGEIKVTLKIQPLVGEVSVLNNEISTYASVTKEGVSILWVEGRKRLESAFAIRYGLADDPRFRIFYVERLSEEAGKAHDPFELDKRQYDVVVLGDISAKRLVNADPDVFRKISTLVTEKGIAEQEVKNHRSCQAQ